MKLNSTGFVRGMMSKSTETEVYFKHVVKTIGHQLEKWDEHYEVKLLQNLLEETSYDVIVKLEDKTYQINLELPFVEALQNKSPYALDRHIWESLKKEGLTIEKTHGDYLENVLCKHLKI